MPRHFAPRKHGFTLVELIVVMTLILFLAGLTARFLPAVTTAAREANTASLVQGWLNMAKQRALRDQAPRGLRLWNKNGDLQVIECEFIEQPDRFSAEPMVTGGNTSTVVFNGTTITNGGAANQDWLVQVGDYICVNQGQMHQIATLALTLPAKTTVTATLNSALPAAIATPTANYYILRAPRPVGDEILQMPLDDATPGRLRGIIIDLNTNSNAPNSSVGNPNAGGPQLPLAALPFQDNGQIPVRPWNWLGVTPAAPFVDILFSPSGSAQVLVGNNLGGSTPTPVVLSGVGNLPPRPIFCLWIRTIDPASNPSNGYLDRELTAKGLPGAAGDPTILALHLSNGFVGAYSPDPSGVLLNGNPYANVE